MTQIFIDIISALRYDFWFYIGLGVVVLGLIIGLVLTFVGGDVNKFKKHAKSFITNATHENASASAKLMPTKVSRAFNRHRATGERPGDAIGIDACVYAPYQATFASKAPLLVLITSIFGTLLAAAGVFISNAFAYYYPYGLVDYSSALLIAVAYAAIIALAGLLVSIIMLVISNVYYKGAVKAYNDYIDALEKLSKGGNYDAPALVTSMPVTQDIEPAVEDIPVAGSDSFNFGVNYATTQERMASTQEEGYYAPAQPQYDFSEQSQNTVEREPAVETPMQNAFASEAHITQDFPVQNGAATFGMANGFDPYVAATPVEPSMTIPRSAETTPVDIPKTKERQAIDDMRERVEKARAARTSTYGPTVTKAPNGARARQGVTGSADELLQKISRAIEDEAPLATLKELALKLQQERAKPENKTPEKQKKLSETQIKLMRAMTGAMKR